MSNSANASQLFVTLAPELFLMAGAMALMLFAAFRKESAQHQRAVGIGAMIVAAITLGLVGMMAFKQYSALDGVVAVDGFRWAADIIFLIATLITLALSLDYYERELMFTAESHVLLLFATSGMMLMAAARDLMVLFLGIEIMSIAVYVLAGLNRRSKKAAESALKYFLLGAFSTGFLLYGIALVYGATGSTNLTVIGARIVELVIGDNPLLLTGVALLMIGFGFKIAAAPFHMWAPDVYEGASTPITGYMASAVKAAAFAAFLRVWLESFSAIYSQWHAALWWISAITMVVGNVVALQQRNLKRMLAYSSIAHTGFILVAMSAGTPQAASAFIFYLAAYTLATMGAFAVMISLGSREQPRELLEDYQGLWLVRPGMAIAMTVFLLALLGFPIFGGMGFFAKWYVLQAALQAPAPQLRLAVVLVLTTTISAGYYLPVIMAMFMKPRPANAGTLPASLPIARTVIFASAVVILVIGAFPDRVVQVISRNSSFTQFVPTTDFHAARTQR